MLALTFGLSTVVGRTIWFQIRSTRAIIPC
jgi:hypothetical protein